MNNLARRNRDVNPWRDFLNLDDFFGGAMSGRNAQLPAVNISENDKSYHVEVVAPGFKKEDFKVKVDDDILTISAETKTENTEEGQNKEYSRHEYSSSSFTRSFQLPDNVKDDSISATYQDGILKLEMPKSEQQQKATKEIAVS
ncbi:Hsp20/alpha crystallin family protein [Ilyomonas limi]|uniref:Hsp20/alpha crystallin family protein n=1 Tax=Ilyomonas limi TaxID=2575867 RepID=A0A4U3L2T7_9BACT|nr:Hsp20/alpha crystallin family protein [Ilyomonas limi]TKK69348.1 Hsp20/alpha crystallin family protein [Ilyomonas limi]